MFARLLFVLALLIAGPLVSGAPALAQSTAAQTEAEELFRLGHAQFQQQQFGQARISFEGALALDPGHQQARSYLIECLVLEGDIEGARALAGKPSAGAPAGEALDSEPPQGPVVDPPPDGATTGAPAPEGGELTPEEAARLRAEAAARQAEAQARHASERAERDAEEASQRAAAAQRAADDAHNQAAAARASRAARKERRNPRGGDRFAIGLGVGGPSATVGLFSELRAGWLGSGVFGIGGFLVNQEGSFRAAAALSGELQLSPVPWRFTPLLGVGLVGFFGGGASAIDRALWSLTADRDTARLVPYGLFGARFDFPKTLWISVAVRLAPSPTMVVMPIPGARMGLRF